MYVSQPSPTTLGYQERLCVFEDFAQALARRHIGHACPNRHAHPQILTPATRHLASHAVLATLGSMQTGMPKIHQRIQPGVTDQENATPVAPIAAIGTALGNIFFPTKADAAVTTISGLDLNCGFVDEFHVYNSA